MTSSYHHAELEPLVRAMLDGGLDETQWAQLAYLLRQDADARAAYLHITTLHAALNWQAGNTQATWPAAKQTDAPAVVGRLGGRWRWAAIAALFVVVVTAWFVALPDHEATRSAPDAQDPSPSGYAMLSDLSSDAVFADDSHPAALGGDLPSGPLRLTAGRAQVLLDGGAVVDLIGPCVFETIGPDHAQLTSGQIDVYVRPEARGFTVETPAGVRVVDLGTRFEMQIDPAGATNVFVHEGRVQVEFAGRHEQFEASEAVRLADGQWMMRRLGTGDDAIVEHFDDAASRGLNAALEDHAGVYTFTRKIAENTGNRNFIRTRATQFVTMDFIAEVTCTLPANSAGPNIVFFGIGGGVPDPSEWDNPIPALYFEAPPMRIEIDSGVDREDSVVHQFSEPGPGRHRLQIRKLGDAVTFAIDENYQGGAFHADQACTLSLSKAAPFLDSTNSRIFFGSQQASEPSTFDDLSIRILTGTSSPSHIQQEN
ncbi:FecR domain-containing protein [Planctomycetales bacterium ZRK34]|nr:FecR domain-containing protein [Planctomycetales bacterium ZRK34]